MGAAHTRAGYRTGQFEGGIRYLALVILGLIVVAFLLTIGRELLFSIPDKVNTLVDTVMGGLL